MENTLLTKLKESTKGHHQSVEKVLVGKLKSLSNLTEYGALLLILHGFYQPLEIRIQELIDETVLPDVKDRVHINKLETDLLYLGYKVNQVQNPFAENIHTISYALGIMYVLEGSTLGGQVISEMLEKKLPSVGKSATAYFNSYGEETMGMWHSFKNYIENAPIAIDEHEMTQGAMDTFEQLRLWLISH